MNLPKTPSGAGPLPQVTLYYDGACPLCSREANVYRRADEAKVLGFVDIAAADFDAAAHGLRDDAVQRTLHARCSDGRVVTGIDAFAAVWRALPHRGYHFLAGLTQVPGLRQVLKGGYAAFALVRPRLPGRKCAAAGCR